MNEETIYLEELLLVITVFHLSEIEIEIFYCAIFYDFDWPFCTNDKLVGGKD